MDAAIAELGGDEEKILANAVAVYAAQNSTGITSDNLITNWLSGDKDTDDMQASANANTLSEAAAIYGLYMSYADSTGAGFNSEGGALQVMTDALSDPDFAAGVGTDEGKAELDAFTSAMSIISSAADDEEALKSALGEGFNNDDLVSMMESLLGG